MREKRYHIALATTVSAVLLWGSVKLGSQYQDTIHVPVSLLNLPAGLAPVSPIPRTLELTFRGRGWQMASHLLDSDLQVPIDVRTGPRIMTLRDVRREIALPENVELIDMKPESVTVAFDNLVEKRIPIIVDNRVSFAEGYGLSGAPVIVPESVTVGGGERVIQTLESWYVATPPMENLKSAVTEQIPLSDNSTYFLSLSPPTVTLKLNVQPLAEKTLNGIPVTVHSLPPDREVLLIPPRVDVLVRGALDRLARITPDECRVSVDFRSIVGDTTRTVVPLIEVPEGIVVIGRTPERLQFVIRQRL